MSLVDSLLKKLEQEMTDIANKALAHPQNRDAFEYGRVCGLYGGLNHAREMLIGLGEEEDARNI